MNITPIKTRRFWPPLDDLWRLLDKSLPGIKENVVVAVASKIVSIGEGRCVPTSRINDKDQLIISEADKYLPRESSPNRWVMHTLKNGVLLPSAGIDESNANGHYILWPKDPTASARKIRRFLCRRRHIKNLGVIITDSRSVPLRRGVVGLALAWDGFGPLYDYRGAKDIFGRGLVFSQANIADGLAAAAVAVMGEGREQTPLALISDIPFVRFINRRSISRRKFSGVVVDLNEDLYYSFLKSVKWRQGGAGRIDLA